MANLLEQQNIWGRPGCQLPSGGLCDACCAVKGFVARDYQLSDGTSFLKEPGIECVFMTRVNIGGQGCGLNPFQPESCQNYYCGDEVPQVKLLLIDYAWKNGLVSEAEAQEAVQLILAV